MNLYVGGTIGRRRLDTHPRAATVASSSDIAELAVVVYRYLCVCMYVSMCVACVRVSGVTASSVRSSHRPCVLGLVWLGYRDQRLIILE